MQDDTTPILTRPPEETEPEPQPKRPEDYELTSRTWKVLKASCAKDGYTFGGGEARAVALLESEGLVELKRSDLCKATPEGQALAAWHTKQAQKAE